MSLRTQAKVLRALEEQRFEPVGAAEFVQVDVRRDAATNKIWRRRSNAEFSRGPFLSPQRDSLPRAAPARARSGHSMLADHFLREFTTAYGRKPKELTRKLPGPADYQWPGQCARTAQLDRADRDSEPAGPCGRSPYSGQ